MVTCVSTHRMRYCISLEDLQKQNLDIDITEDEQSQKEWACDMVTCEDLEEFSQEWLGEQIVDTQIISEDKMIEIFDKENEYLKNWIEDQKIEWVKNTIKKK